MDLPARISDHLGLPRDVALQLATVIVGGLQERVAIQLGRAAGQRLARALPELASWRLEAGMTAEVDGRRLALAMGRSEVRTVGVLAEVLYGLGAEPAAADLMAPIVRTWLAHRLGIDNLETLAQVAPFLAGVEPTPIPTARA